jgi:hypothetical protein
MNKLITILLVAGLAGSASAEENGPSTSNALALTSVANEAALAAAVIDAAAYRRAALTHIDELALQRDPRALSGGVWVPGPRAMLLARDGMDMPDALSAARAAGEYPRFMSADAARALRAAQARLARDGVAVARTGLASGSDALGARARGGPAR